MHNSVSSTLIFMRCSVLCVRVSWAMDLSHARCFRVPGRLQPTQTVSGRGPLKPNGLGVCLSVSQITIKDQVCGTQEAWSLAFLLSGCWETFEAKERGLNSCE